MPEIIRSSLRQKLILTSMLIGLTAAVITALAAAAYTWIKLPHGISHSVMAGVLQSSLAAVLCAMFGVLPLAFVVGSHLQRIICKPIVNLTGVTQRICDEQDYGLRVVASGWREMNLLTVSFNRLLEKIEKRESSLARTQPIQKSVLPFVSAGNHALAGGLSEERQEVRNIFARPSCWNRVAVLERLGGDEELLQELCNIFLMESPVLLKKLSKGIAEQDCDMIKTTAHKLKGEVSYLSAAAATQAARKLEKMGYERNLRGAPETFVVLKTELERLRSSIQKMAEVES